ncbi:cardiolipin synthase (CMP-forming)-like [Watersipora subatra]|uniref:cardiolipin synthase (CMP-forming)-like n=1 Tax=Watersipora subatra TaxID=2589382 RepID=UPI00355C7F06
MVALSTNTCLVLLRRCQLKPWSSLLLQSRVFGSSHIDGFLKLNCKKGQSLNLAQHFSMSRKKNQQNCLLMDVIPTRQYSSTSDNQEPASNKKELKENIYTIPNYLTVGRFFISPFLGYMVLQEQFAVVCGLFIVTGLTDLLDGYIARNWKGQSSILGSVIDPLADKFLVTILAITLTAVHLIPVWLTALVLSRDVYLVLSGFRVRWNTLPPPKTFKRYFDFSHPTAQVQPSLISKVNTNIQLLLLTATCAAPVFGYVDHVALQTLWGVTAITTAWSFIDYLIRVPYTTLKDPV